MMLYLDQQWMKNKNFENVTEKDSARIKEILEQRKDFSAEVLRQAAAIRKACAALLHVAQAARDDFLRPTHRETHFRSVRLESTDQTHLSSTENRDTLGNVFPRPLARLS